MASRGPVGVVVTSFLLAASLYKTMSLFLKSVDKVARACMGEGRGKSYLESILAGEALVAKVAWEGLHGQMDALMPLQVVIPVESHRALVAFEGSLGLGILRVAVHRRHHVVTITRHAHP